MCNNKITKEYITTNVLYNYGNRNVLEGSSTKDKRILLYCDTAGLSQSERNRARRYCNDKTQKKRAFNDVQKAVNSITGKGVGEIDD